MRLTSCARAHVALAMTGPSPQRMAPAEALDRRRTCPRPTAPPSIAAAPIAGHVVIRRAGGSARHAGCAAPRRPRTRSSVGSVPRQLGLSRPAPRRRLRRPALRVTAGAPRRVPAPARRRPAPPRPRARAQPAPTPAPRPRPPGPRHCRRPSPRRPRPRIRSSRAPRSSRRVGRAIGRRSRRSARRPEKPKQRQARRDAPTAAATPRLADPPGPSSSHGERGAGEPPAREPQAGAEDAENGTTVTRQRQGESHGREAASAAAARACANIGRCLASVPTSPIGLALGAFHLWRAAAAGAAQAGPEHRAHARPQGRGGGPRRAHAPRQLEAASSRRAPRGRSGPARRRCAVG